MTKRHNAKYKIDRRQGANIWGRAKSPFNVRAYKPGEHGPLGSTKRTDYGNQLWAKQRLKGYYGNISEKKMVAYYKEAIRIRGNSSEALIGLLESRLDAIVYRAKIAPTVFAARQIVNHGHILVNGKCVNIASFNVRAGDVVEVATKAREMALIVESTKSKEREVPEYISVEDNGFKATYARVPALADVPYPVKMEPDQIIEFYSK